MRQKPPSEDIITKYISFLLLLKEFCDSEDDFKIGFVIKEAKVSSQASKSLQDLSFIRKNGNRFEWFEQKPSRHLALKLLDHMLHKNKKTLHVPIFPELATAIGLFDKIATKLDNTTALLDVAVRRLKNGQIQEGQIQQSETLFSENHQYHNDFVTIAAALVQKTYTMTDIATVELLDLNRINNNILIITADLLNKINNLKTETNGQFKN